MRGAAAKGLLDHPRPPEDGPMGIARMLISRYELQVSPEFTLTRTDAGVSLHFSYDLSGSQEDDGTWVWDGSILSELGEDEGGTSQMSDRPMSLTYSATLADGVTETGSYEVTDAGDEGIAKTVEFDVTTFSSAATFKGEGPISHFVFGSDEGDDFTGARGADVLNGAQGDDTVHGGGGDDRLSGGGDDDVIHGGAGLDNLRGNAGDDELFGGDGDDRLAGRVGDDAMSGGAGADSFVFRETLGGEDTILDFTSGEDRIRLDDAVFEALETGALGEGVFVANADGEATEEGQRLIYNTTDGLLFYDADGSGGGEAVLIVKLGAGVTLTADDLGVF